MKETKAQVFARLSYMGHISDNIEALRKAIEKIDIHP